MIDTIKFKVKVSDDQYKLLNEKRSALQKAKQNIKIIWFFTDNVQFRMYVSNFHIEMECYRSLYLLIFLHKYMFFYYLLLIYMSQRREEIYDIYKKLVKYFNFFLLTQIEYLLRLEVKNELFLKNQPTVSGTIISRILFTSLIIFLILIDLFKNLANTTPLIFNFTIQQYISIKDINER